MQKETEPSSKRRPKKSCSICYKSYPRLDDHVNRKHKLKWGVAGDHLYRSTGAHSALTSGVYTFHYSTSVELSFSSLNVWSDWLPQHFLQLKN